MPLLQVISLIPNLIENGVLQYGSEEEKNYDQNLKRAPFDTY